MGGGTSAPRARLAELVAALSLGVDLGFGQPMEHVLRQCLIALRLAGRMGLGEQDRMAVYYTALLVNVGCHADAHEQAKWFGDDITLKSGKYVHELGSVRGALAAMRLVGAGNPPLHRFRVGLGFAFSGYRQMDGMIAQHAKLAGTLAGQLGLPSVVREGVGAAYEHWDGRGWPGTLKAGAIPVAARIAQIAEFTEVAHRVGGMAAAIALARRRSGRQFDPALAALLCSHAEGHSVAVAELAEEAGRRLGLPPGQVLALRRAGLVHGFGRLGVSNSIWDRPGPLSAGEWERVRMYPYLTERMLHQSAALAPLGEIAVQHRERLDGSGYPRGLSGGAISRPARVLGPPTPTPRCASPGRTGRPGRRTRPPRRCGPRPRRCGPRSRPAAWMARRHRRHVRGAARPAPGGVGDPTVPPITGTIAEGWSGRALPTRSPRGSAGRGRLGAGCRAGRAGRLGGGHRRARHRQDPAR